jgi:hypothetical protein
LLRLDFNCLEPPIDAPIPLRISADADRPIGWAWIPAALIGEKYVQQCAAREFQWRQADYRSRDAAMTLIDHQSGDEGLFELPPDDRDEFIRLPWPSNRLSSDEHVGQQLNQH